MPRILLKNGMIVTEDSLSRKDVLIEDGKIAQIGDSLKLEVDQVMDVSGKHILSGLIDAHVHFRQPGATKKEDFRTGSRAAIAGGVTTVFDMPNNDPPTVNLKNLEAKRKLINGISFCDYGFYIGAQKEYLDELALTRNTAGIKVYMGSSTGGLLLDDQKSLERIFRCAKLIVIHAEDEKFIQKNVQKYQAIQGSEKHGLIRSASAAKEAVKKALHLAKKFNTRLHIAHVSTKEELEVIKKFQSERISFEVCPHHLFLTEEDYFTQGHFMKVNPPLRFKKDLEALWEALASRLVDIIATDHAPHLKKEKEQSYELAPAGVPGLETMLPLLLDAVNKSRLNLRDVARLTSANPARLFALKNKGFIAKGFDADLVVVDMELEREVQNENLHTKCGWSPFNGWKLKGWPLMTFLRGEMVMQDGKVSGRPRGKEVEFWGGLNTLNLEV